MSAKKLDSTELNIEPGESIMQKLKLTAKLINDEIQLYTSGASHEFSEYPTTPEYDQASVNQNDMFPAPPQVTT